MILLVVLCGIMTGSEYVCEIKIKYDLHRFVCSICVYDNSSQLLEMDDRTIK